MKRLSLSAALAALLLLSACAVDPALREGEQRNRDIAAGVWRLAELRQACTGDGTVPGRALSAAEAAEQQALVTRLQALAPDVWPNVALSAPRVAALRQACAGDPATGLAGRPLTREEAAELQAILYPPGAAPSAIPAAPGAAGDIIWTTPPAGPSEGATGGVGGTVIWDSGPSARPDWRYEDQRRRWEWEREQRHREMMWHLEMQRRDAERRAWERRRREMEHRHDQDRDHDREWRDRQRDEGRRDADEARRRAEEERRRQDEARQRQQEEARRQAEEERRRRQQEQQQANPPDAPRPSSPRTGRPDRNDANER